MTSPRYTVPRAGAAAALLSVLLTCGACEAPLAPAAMPSRADAPVAGYADLHNHVFGEYAYEGAWYHGSVLGPEAGNNTHEGMGACDGNRPGGPQDHAMTVDNLLCRVAGLALEDVCLHVDHTQGYVEGAPAGEQYTGWPHATTIAHQQNWWGHLHDAWEDGQRLMVVSGVNFRILCQLMAPENTRFDYDCEDLAAVDLQIAAAKDFAALHDDWVEIAYSPAEARRIISSGKMALVLAIEVTDIFPTGAMDDAPMVVAPDGTILDRGGVFTQLRYYHDLGVRSIQLAHEFDSRFAGVAVFSEIFKLLYVIDDFLQAHPRPEIQLPGTRRNHYGFDLDANGYNTLGLTDEGRQLVQAMIDLGMPLDTAHLSQRALEDVFEIAKLNDYHPMFNSHTKLQQIVGPPRGEDLEKFMPEWIVDRLRATGGMLGLRTHSEPANTYPDSPVANTCDGSSRSFAQTLAYLWEELNIPAGFAVDMNGFATQLGARFGEDACPAAPDEATQAAQQAQQTDDGTGTRFDLDGLGQVGMTGRGLRVDLEALGLDTSPLDGGAEAFIRMWERAEDPLRSGPVGPPPVSDRSQLVKGLTAASGLQLEALVPGPLAQARSYTFSVTAGGGLHTAQLLSGGDVLAEVRYDPTATVTASRWVDLRFGEHLTVKLGAEDEAGVPLSTLGVDFFDGAQRLTLAYP